MEELTLCLLLCVVILLCLLRRFSNFLRWRTPANAVRLPLPECVGIRRRSPRNCWRSRYQIFGGLKTPAPFSVESLQKLGGKGPLSPPENIFSGFFLPGQDRQTNDLRKEVSPKTGKVDTTPADCCCQPPSSTAARCHLPSSQRRCR